MAPRQQHHGQNNAARRKAERQEKIPVLLPERDRQHRIQHRPQSPRREALARAAGADDFINHRRVKAQGHHAAREFEDVVSVHRHTISQAKALGHFLLDLEF